MDVILMERVGKLGHIGDTVRVKDGYARNFLLPRGKALRATEANKKKFEVRRADLEARNHELKRDANEVSAKLEGATVVIVRQAGETGQLYGSVSARDIAEALTAAGHPVQRGHVAIQHPIKTLGLHPVPIHLHPEVEFEGHRQRRTLGRAGRTTGEGRRPFGARTDLDGRFRARSRQGAGRGGTRRESWPGVSHERPRTSLRANYLKGLTPHLRNFSGGSPKRCRLKEPRDRRTATTRPAQSGVTPFGKLRVSRGAGLTLAIHVVGRSDLRGMRRPPQRRRVRKASRPTRPMNGGADPAAVLGPQIGP